MTTLLEKFAQTARRIEKEMLDERSLSYEFRSDGDWCEVLRRLPFDCVLFRTYRRYDEARAAYEAEADRRQRWSAELDQVRHQIHQVEQERDPDTIDYAAFVQAEAKAKVLARRLSDEHGILNELRDVMNRADENWSRVWFAYLELKAQEQQIAGADFVPSIEGYSPKAEALQAIRERIKQYEAPRG